jgi:hypothetical protein
MKRQWKLERGHQTLRRVSYVALLTLSSAAMTGHKPVKRDQNQKCLSRVTYIPTLGLDIKYIYSYMLFCYDVATPRRPLYAANRLGNEGHAAGHASGAQKTHHE